MLLSPIMPMKGTGEGIYPAFCFRRKDQLLSDPTGKIETADEQKSDDEEEEAHIVCRHCTHFLTQSSNRVSVDGAHTHVFSNPHGYVFEIVCFRNVTGVLHTGIITDDFSWFRGYGWRIAVCGNCRIHLGWGFSGDGREPFHALIVKHIAESRSTYGGHG